MNAEIDTYARTIVYVFGTGILAGAALAVLVALAIRALRPSATTQHALWWIVLGATVALPAATACVSFGHVEHFAASTHVAPPEPARAGTADAFRDTAPVTSGVAPAPAAIDWLAIAVTAGERTMRYPGIATLLVSLWLGIAALRACVLVYGFIALMRMKASSIALDESVVRRLRRFRYGARSGRRVAILVSAGIDVPVAVGFNRPAILLPTAVAEHEEIADLDQIVMHEHAHLNRYDDVTNFLQCAFEALFWFNPVVVLVGREIALQREIACDDSVIAQTGRAHRYATCLWRLVESARLPARRIGAPGALFTPKQITTRIEQLLDSKRNALPRLSPLSAIVLAALSAALIFTQALRAPVIALEDPAPRVPPVVTVAPIALKPFAVPSPAPPAPPALPAVPAGIRIASDATPEAIATAVIEAAMKRSLLEARRASKLQAVSARERAAASREQTAALAKAAAAMGTGFGLDVARQISEKLAPLAEWPAIERSIAEARKSAQHAIASANVVADSDLASRGVRRSFGAFHTVRVDGDFDVEVRRGSNPSVDFQDDSFVASHTRTDVEGDTLVIEQADGSYSTDHRKTILVYVASLEGVEINGSADVRVVDAHARRLSVNISGSGDFTGSGNAGAANVTVEGSGNADLARLRATSISVDIEGSGDVTLAAPDTLSVRIAGSGDVRMSGVPKHLSSDINGSGGIVKM